MKIIKDDLVYLFEILGSPTAGTWNDKRLAKKLEVLPMNVDEETDAEDCQELLNEILVAISEEQEIEILDVPEEEIKPLIESHFLKKDGTRRKAGTIQTLVEFLQEASEENPINKNDLCQKVLERLPNKTEKSVMSSIDSQVPTRLKQVKGIIVHKNKNGYWIDG